MTSSSIKPSRTELSAISQTSSNNLPPLMEQSAELIGQAFWPVRHMISSPTLGQVPFLLWLVEALEPRLIVQAGLGDGAGYLALCQAAERLNKGTVCRALASGHETPADDLRKEHDRFYADFSQIILPEQPDHPLPEDAEIDLLVLNRPLESGARDEFTGNLLPRLSQSGAVLVLDPAAVFASPETRKLLVQTSVSYLALDPVAPGGAAVDLFLCGTTPSGRPDTLLAQEPGRLSWLSLRQAFKQLGQGLVATQGNADMQQQWDALERRCQQADVEAQALREEIARARASESAEIERQATLAARVHDLQQALSQARQDHDARIDDIAVLTATYQAEIRKAARQGEERAEQALRQLEEVRVQHGTRVDDIAALAGRHRQDMEQAEARNAALVADLKKRMGLAAEGEQKANERAAELDRELALVRAHRDDLLASTSWRVTAPLRKVASLVRGR